jgi:hypothetical protein
LVVSRLITSGANIGGNHYTYQCKFTFKIWMIRIVVI